jgi:phosphohistidine phosphatase
VARRIYLLRHAKSDWGDQKLPDHGRPLNNRGRRSAAELPATLARENITPDLVLVSTATRAAQTAEPLGLATRPEPALYDASVADLLGVLRGLPDDVQSVMLVGHNPGMEALAAEFGDDDGMSTATLIAFDVDADAWSSLDPGKATERGRWEHPGKKA